MPGIGISPCPPFTKPPLAPGVLYDGNTVAWYKHNDLRTVFQDGANRVNHWLDRMNYAIGADLIAGWDFTVGWVAGGGAVIIDENTFTGAIINDFIRAAAFPLVANTTYRVTYSWQITAGTNLLINDFNNATTYNTFAGNGAVQTGEFCFTTTVAPAGVGISLAVNGGMPCQVDIFHLEIEPIAGNHLLQNNAAKQPLHSMADGVLFDGLNDYMQTLPFVYNQPEFIYFVGRQITWTLNDYFFDGTILNTGYIYQSAIIPEIKGMAQFASATNNNLILNIFSIIRLLLNGVNSSLQVNLTVPVLWNCGVGNMTGFTISSSGVYALSANIEIKEIILRNVADGAGVQAEIYNYLRNANGCG